MIFFVCGARIPGLALVKLGCPGETTSTMIHGGIYSYDEGSQLSAAIRFIRTHRIAFITIDIGGNDIDNCIAITDIDSTCFSHALSTVGGNLPANIGSAAKRRGSKHDDYRYELLRSFVGGLDARPEWTSFGVRILAGYDGIQRHPSERIRGVRHSNLPLNVFLTLSWTWMGAAAPLGPNIHPNSLGYAVIAGAFTKKLGTL